MGGVLWQESCVAALSSVRCLVSEGFLLQADGAGLPLPVLQWMWGQGARTSRRLPGWQQRSGMGTGGGSWLSGCGP